MHCLLTYIDRLDRKAETKYRCAIGMLGAPGAVAGFFIWLTLRALFAADIDWLLCLIGYPVVIAWLIVSVYTCKYGLHNGTYKKDMAALP